MKIQAQRHDSLSRIAQLVEDIDICMLTTVSHDGKLLSRPMGALEMDADGSFWFFTSASSAKAHQLESVNVAFSAEDDATYVSVSGVGELVHDRERIDALWTLFAKPWFPRGKDDPDLALLKVTPEIAEYWDANSSKMVRTLALLASAAVGRPVGLGEHDVVSNPSARSVANEADQRTFLAE